MSKRYWNNKNVFITGGTSGLGKNLALQLKELGANVAILARTQSKIDEILELNPDIIAIRGDVSDKLQIHPIAGEVHSRLGDVDVLVNAASYLGETPLRLFIDSECEDFEEVLQTNLLGPFRLTKAILPAMILKEKGVVVNISSDAAIQAYPTWGAYSVSKAAVDHMSRIFQAELVDQGVQFLSVDPGDMATPMHFAAIPDAKAEDLKDPALAASQLIELISSEDKSEVRRKL